MISSKTLFFIKKSAIVTLSTLFLAAASMPVMAQKHIGHNKMKMGKMKHKAMAHANPMPNLMRMIMKHGDKLNLTAEQKKALAKWRMENMPKSKARVKTILAKEALLMKMALDNKPKAALLTEMDAMLSVRKELATGKIMCRDNMSKILNKEQFSSVLMLYSKSQGIHMKKHSMGSTDGHPIQISGAWARKTLVKGGNSAAFMTFTNTGSKDNELVEAVANISQRVELHTHIKRKDGIMQMRKLKGGIPLKASQDTKLQRGGLHIMFIKMTRDLKEGDTFKLTLKFKHGQDKTIMVPAKMTMGGGHKMMNHGGHH